MYLKFNFLALSIAKTEAASVEHITDPISKLSTGFIFKQKWQKIPTKKAVIIVPKEESRIACVATGFASFHLVPKPP